MNSLINYRYCTLSDEELLKRVDEQTDNMFRTQKVPTRNIPARFDEDYDLLIGELIMRFNELIEKK